MIIVYVIINLIALCFACCFLNRLLTRNKTEIPLLFVMFNYQKYKNQGKLNSCMLHIHPLLSYDEHVKNTLNDLVDYIRDNYEMKEM